MSYIPHAVIGSTGSGNGTVSGVNVLSVINRPTNTKYMLYLDVRLVNVPGSKSLQGVRYLGSLTLNLAAPGNTLYSGTATALFDDLIEGAITAGVAWSDIEAGIKLHLSGAVVTVVNVGGRWLVR